MRAIFITLFVLLAVPAFAQNERACRGKQAFDLGDGAYGCLFDVGTTSITTKATRDDGASSKQIPNGAGRIDVAMFGAYTDPKRVTSARLRTIYQTFLPALQAETPHSNYHRIDVRLLWPRAENTGDMLPTDQSENAVQLAFTTDTRCGARCFG